MEPKEEMDGWSKEATRLSRAASRVRWLCLFALLLAVALGGCTRYSATQIAVYGPYQGRSTTDLLRLCGDALTTRGYRVLALDEQRGQLTVEARTHVRHGPITFRVQVYQEGWIQLVPEGRHVRSAGAGSISMPVDAVGEYVALAERLLPRSGAGGSQ